MQPSNGEKEVRKKDEDAVSSSAGTWQLLRWKDAGSCCFSEYCPGSWLLRSSKPRSSLGIPMLWGRQSIDCPFPAEHVPQVSQSCPPKRNWASPLSDVQAEEPPIFGSNHLLFHHGSACFMLIITFKKPFSFFGFFKQTASGSRGLSAARTQLSITRGSARVTPLPACKQEWLQVGTVALPRN